MDRLDQIVIDQVSTRILQPERLGDLLRTYLKSANSRLAENKERLGGLRQAYTRLAVTEVCVKDKEIRISGSKSALARAASQGLDNNTAPGVLSFVQEWRTRQDSNL